MTSACGLSREICTVAVIMLVALLLQDLGMPSQAGASVATPGDNSFVIIEPWRFVHDASDEVWRARSTQVYEEPYPDFVNVWDQYPGEPDFFVTDLKDWLGSEPLGVVFVDTHGGSQGVAVEPYLGIFPAASAYNYYVDEVEGITETDLYLTNLEDRLYYGGPLTEDWWVVGVYHEAFAMWVNADQTFLVLSACETAGYSGWGSHGIRNWINYGAKPSWPQARTQSDLLFRYLSGEIEPSNWNSDPRVSLDAVAETNETVQISV